MRHRSFANTGLPTVACLVVAAVALTGEPAAAQVSHVGQNTSDHVVLRDGSLSGRFVDNVCTSGSFKGKGLFRVSPDGTLAAAPFTVPAGRHLVITDVEWTVSGTTLGLSLAPGATVRTRIQIGNGSPLTSVFLSDTVQVDSAGTYVSGSEQLTTGFVVAPNTTICPSSVEFSSGALISANLIEFVLRGYLINAQ
jgi:hypothetical protein